MIATNNRRKNDLLYRIALPPSISLSVGVRRNLPLRPLRFLGVGTLRSILHSLSNAASLTKKISRLLAFVGTGIESSSLKTFSVLADILPFFFIFPPRFKNVDV